MSLLSVIERAARRVKSPAAQRSVATARRQYERLANVELPPVELVHRGPIRISAGETWCACCGDATAARMPCCAHPRPVPVEQILRPEEYAIAA